MTPAGPRRFAADDVPAGLRDLVSQHVPQPGMPLGLDWLPTLPRLVEELVQMWELHLDGPPRHGYAALVLPVRRPDGSPAALKVVWPHLEGVDEHRSLHLWAGRGAVRLLATDRPRWGLLLERLDAERDLHTVDVMRSCERIGSLLVTLDRVAPPWARRSSDGAQQLLGDIDRLQDDRGFPRRMLQQTRSLVGELLTDPAVDARLLHSDLHQGNVLWRPDPGEWVAIDPQTMAGEVAFGLAPALWNRWEETAASGDVRRHLRRRLAVLSEAAGADTARAKAWSIVRMVRNAVWALQAPTPATDGEVTKMVTIVKALQD